MKFEAEVNKQKVNVEINEDSTFFTSGGRSGDVEFSHENGRYFLRLGTKLYNIDNVSNDGPDIAFTIDTNWHTVTVKDEQELLLDQLGFKSGSSSSEGSLKAPMPGKILDIMVNVGDDVTKDQPLVILEAMKMENELKSHTTGRVSTIHVEVGQSLEKHTPILEIEVLG